MSETITLPETLAAPVTGPSIANAIAISSAPVQQAAVVAPAIAPEAAVKVAEKIKDNALGKLTKDLEKGIGVFQQLGKDLKNLHTAHDKAENLANAAEAQAQSHVQCGDCTTLVVPEQIQKQAALLGKIV